MIKKQLAFAILFVASAITSSSASAVEESLYCSNPATTICSDSSFKSQASLGRSLIKKEISQEAKKAAEPRVILMKKKIPAIRIFKRLAAKIKIRNEEIMKAARRVLGDLETVSTSVEDVAKIKSYLYDSIDQASSLGPEVKNYFKATVEEVTVSNYGDFLDKLEANPEASKSLENMCGEDGLTDNAFAFHMNENGESKKYVLICPGFIVNLKLMKDHQERFDFVLQTLGHEISHHIDDSMYYTKFLYCVGTRLTTKLSASCNNEVPECRVRKAMSHSKEMIADEWGNRIMALHSIATKMTLKQTEKMVYANVAPQMRGFIYQGTCVLGWPFLTRALMNCSIVIAGKKRE
jgi:hypothetical protein